MTMDGSKRAAVGVLAAVALALTGCGDSAEPGDAEAAATEEEPYSRVVNVEVRPVEETSFTERIRLTGVVEANQDVEVSAEESGRIRRVLVEKGERVRDGEPLIKIDDAILRAQVEQARARASLASEMWDRRKRLWEQDSVGTEAAYLEARANAREASANLDLLEERLARTTIRAPFDGILDDRMVEVGQMVSSGMPVARVVELDTVDVTGGVPERFAPDVEAGSSVSVSFDVLPGRTYEGEISFVGSTVNARNRTFPVEFTLANPEGVVKPQMVANISLVRRTRDRAVVIPQEALVRTEEGFRAFVVERVDDRSVVRARDVAVGPSQGDRVVIEEGLAPADLLVVVGQQQVAEGDRVRVVEAARSERGPVDRPEGADPDEPGVDPDEPGAQDSTGAAPRGAAR